MKTIIILVACFAMTGCSTFTPREKAQIETLNTAAKISSHQTVETVEKTQSRPSKIRIRIYAPKKESK
jgi:outer membrane PBP1 activator LpoA protein